MMKKVIGLTIGALLLAFCFFTVLLFPPCSLLLAPCFSADAQQPTKVPRIGYLQAPPPSAVATRTDAFRQGLRELGYVEEKNIIVDYRYGEGKADRERELAAELARLKVDVIVTTGPTVTRSAKQVTATIPIVMGFDDDPVGSGFVASLARPGGNITGLSTLSPELSGKQLELLKEIIPRLSRVAVVGSSTHPGTAQSLKELELATAALKVRFKTSTYSTPRKLRRHSEPRAKAALTQSSCSRAWSRILIENRLSMLQQRTGSRRSITLRSGWKPEGL
jgi:ABC-type uncharacterized transport system substrate-binding protein